MTYSTASGLSPSFTNYPYQHVGARPQGKSTSFVVWAPEQQAMDVLVNGVGFPMKKDTMGYWSAAVDGVPAGSEYLFRINGQQSFPDPASRHQPNGVHGPSAVCDTSFPWSDDDWKGIPMEQMIIYELHVGTFSPSGDFQGIVEKLPYLQALGVNAIELMPVAQFPGQRNWGYDGVFPFAVQQSYGGVHGLKTLVNEAHRHGIAILLDVVYNHLGPEGNYLEAYAPYFTDRYKTVWGKAINFDDAWCDGVRNFFWQNALMWLDEFRIDGLRLDAVHAIWDFSASHFIDELRKHVSSLQIESSRTKVLIAEFDLNNPRYINPPSRGGYGLDAQWIDEFHHALHSLITGERDGYYEDFGTAEHLAKSFRDSYVYTGQFSVHRKKTFGAPAGNPYDQFVVFAQNHDQIGNRLLGDRLSASLSLEALKLVAAAYLLSPHVPLLFMGEEYGEKNPFQYFISHADEKLVEAVRDGRKKEFAYFNWAGEVPDPQSPEVFEQCKLSWNHERDGQSSVLLSYYKHLISLRRSRPAMKETSRNSVTVDTGIEQNVIRVARRCQKDSITIIMNFNDKPAEISLPGELSRIFDSSAGEWGGPGIPADRAGGDRLLNAHSAAIFE